MSNLAVAFRNALRTVVKDGRFSLVIILILTIGIASTTAVVTVLDSVLYRSFPFKDSARLVVMWSKNLKIGWQEEDQVSPLNLADWRESTRSFSSMAAFTWYQSFNASGEEAPQRIRGSRVSENLFSTLGVSPVMGRAFDHDDMQRGRVAIIGYGVWHSRFGGRGDVLSKNIRLNGEPYEIVGVLPPNFPLVFLNNVDVLIPLKLTNMEAADRSLKLLCVVGRLKPDVSLAQASQEMSAVAAQLGQRYPEDKEWTTNLVPLRQEGTGDVREKFSIFLGIAVLILAISCANIASLMLSRVSRRWAELAVRIALGATRTRLLAQLFLENLILALGAGVLGLIGAYVIAKQLLVHSPVYFPPGSQIRTDWRIFVSCLILSVLTGLLFTLVPAFSAMKLNISQVLTQASSRLSATGVHRGWSQRTLVVLEVGLSFVLLIGAGLMIRTFLQISQVNLGFDAKGLLNFQISLAKNKYAEPVTRLHFYHELLRRLRTVPGITSATAVSHLPLGASGMNNYFRVEGDQSQTDKKANTSARVVMPNYFSTAGIKILRGRSFSETAESVPVTIISRELAQRYFPGEDPIGKHIMILQSLQPDPDAVSPGPREIIGVAEDVREAGPDKQPWPEAYFSYEQTPVPSMAVMLRTKDQTPIMPDVQTQAMQVDPDQPIYNVKSMDDVLEVFMDARRFQVSTVVAFSAIAVLLAVSGLYSVISASVAQRRQEIGIRMALGAQPRTLVGMILADGLLLGALGIGLGMIGAFMLTRFIYSLLYGTSPQDPGIFSIITIVLAAVIVLACYLPALRAAKVEPSIVLRSE